MHWENIVNNIYDSIESIINTNHKWKKQGTGVWEYKYYLIDRYNSRVELSYDNYWYSFQLDELNVISIVREFVENPDRWPVFYHNEQIKAALANLE